MSYKQYYTRKLINPLLKLISQGVSPHKLSLTVSFGVVFGLFPVFGLASILSIICALVLRLNIVALQLINYFMYPLWLLLFIPFLSVGNILFDAPTINLSLEEIERLFSQDLQNAIELLGMAHLRAVLVWAVSTPLLGVFAYYATLPLFKRYAMHKIEVS